MYSLVMKQQGTETCRSLVFLKCNCELNINCVHWLVKIVEIKLECKEWTMKNSPLLQSGLFPFVGYLLRASKCFITLNERLTLLKSLL
jgi:hypothetical protein